MLESKFESDLGTLKVALSGDVDIYAAPELKKQLSNLIDQHKSDVVLDCIDLNYIDSTGLGVLVVSLKKAKDYGKTIRIINIKPYIRKLFSITGLEKLFLF